MYIRKQLFYVGADRYFELLCSLQAFMQRSSTGLQYIPDRIFRLIIQFRLHILMLQLIYGELGPR